MGAFGQPAGQHRPITYWTWKCPECDGGGKKPLKRVHARRAGVLHLKLIHKIKGEPILINLGVVTSDTV